MVICFLWNQNIQWWDSSIEALGNLEYPFISIPSRSAQTQSGSTW